MRPTFSGFYIARSGIQAARSNLDVTGQNLANLSTDGYTRQRVDSTALAGSAIGMRYANPTDLNIGQGVSMNSVTQIRDPYLDLRYRIANANVGDMAVTQNAKSSMETVFNEITNDNGLQAQFNKFISNLDSLNSNQGNANTEGLVRGTAEQLAQMFRGWSGELSTIKSNQLGYFQSGCIDKVNSLLKSIAAVNTQIKEADVCGSQALELQDQRNQDLDELSKYAEIEVQYNSVSVGAGHSVSEMSIKLVGANGKKFQLLDHDKYGSFNLKTQNSDGNPMEEPVILEFKNIYGTNTATDGMTAFDNSDIRGGEMNSYLMLLNDNGEYDAANKQTLFTNLGDKATRINTLLTTISTANNKVNANDPNVVDYEKQRTQAIAELKTYLDINVTKNATNNSMLDITLNTTGNGVIDDISLVSGMDAPAKLTAQQKVPNQNYSAELKVTNGAGSTVLTEDMLTKGDIKFDIYRLNADNTVAVSSITEHGIGYYQKRLDTLASTFADTINRVNSTNEKDKTTDYNKSLFSNGDGSSSTYGITAANISISKKWVDTKGSYITISKDGGTTSNILYMKQQISAQKNFATPQGTPLFTGGALDYATDMANTVGQEVNAANNLSSRYTTSLSDIDTLRQSTSSVSIDDEGINLISFGQALTASSRVMTTLDEALDVIINKMGRVGN